MGWKGITRSLCGTRHQQQGLPCQDFGAHWISGDLVVGAIADGAGSAKYADLGAKLAVTTLVDYLKASDQWLQGHQSSWTTLPSTALPGTTRKCFSKGTKAVQTVLQQQAQKQGCSIDDFACTLLAFLATPQWIAALQIGDGFMVIRTGEGASGAASSRQNAYRLLFEADKGEYANQTTFVTSSGALNAIQTEVFNTPPQFICASTDGLDSVAIRQRDAFPFPPFFRPLEEFMEEKAVPEQNDDYVMDFLSSDRLNQRTDDDKTLLMCQYSHDV